MERAARVTRARARTGSRAAASSSSAARRAATSRLARGRGKVRGARVAPAAKSDRAPRRGRGAAEARCRSIFTTAVALMIALTSLGLARVAVIARAAEMTISSDSLSKRIKEQRVRTDQLEIDRSSLTAPSRIEAIAADSMSMGDPASVSYIVMPEGEAPKDGYAADSAAARADAAGGDRVAAVVSALLDMSAGEAQALLVGDLGLAGSR